MSPWPDSGTGVAGIDPGRVAEVLVRLGSRPGQGRRGSGYRVSSLMVLTAAHVVADAVEVRVRFDADRPEEWVAEATVAWADATIDVAVLTIDAGAGGAGALGPVGFGRVGERDAVLACSVMGFPRFKLRNDPARRGSGGDAGRLTQYRDSAHAVGTIAVLSNRREGTLEVSVPSPERDLDPQASPWEGMSGAAVWSGGRIVGLVGEHHRRDGLGRLAAWRVDRWYERLPADRLAELGALLGLPAQAHGLAEVVPPAAGELLVAGYAAQVRDIAPEVLVDREEELAELVRFCAGQERYRWWQARPWAGKSALAAWLVLHPPAGVTVVSFFVTGRLAGQADSDAFTEAMVEQLAAVAGEPLSATAASATLAGRDRERRRLLEAAAARVSEQGGRLLVVVDGLDEDEGATPGSGKPSIASLLPKRPPEGVRVLVTSRPHPGVPADVPGDHPLHRCYHHPRLLTPSPHAQHLEQEANHELLELLAGDRLGIDVIALLSAAGGGLTLAELAELTGQPHHKLQGKLGSVLGRSLRTRLARDEPPDRAGRVYLFAHETLRALAEAQLGRDLGPYRQRIHQWADRYRTRGWPEATPRYLLRPYGRLLAASGDLERLVAIATDPARQDRMLAATHGDAAALAEITTAQQRILAQPPPDLAALGRLAVFRDRLATRNRAIPRELPILWARLGQGHHAEALARSITDPEDRAWALIKLTELLVGADRDRALRLAADAEQAARTITDPKDQATALAEVAEALAGIGAYDRAEALARSITDPKDQAWALVKLAEALVEANRDRALRLAADAEQTARAITDPEDQARALGNLAWALAGVDRDRAGRLKADAEQAADAITDPPWQGETLAWVGTALDGGDYDHAEAFARSIDDPKDQATALAWVAEALARDGAYDRAEALARSIDDPKDQATVLAQVAEALARNGAYDRAEAFARSIDDPKGQATALVKLAEALVEVDRDRALVLAADAEQAARTITHPSWQARALGELAEALAGVGAYDRAEALARGITDPYWQASALGVLAEVLVGVDQDRALVLAADAEQAARTIADPEDQAKALVKLAEVLAGVGAYDRAEALARSIDHPGGQAWALGALAKALAGVGAYNRAEALARGFTHPSWQASALGELAGVLAGVDRERALVLAADAEQAARAITHPRSQAETLRDLAEALASVDRDRAEALARSITDPFDQAWALGALAAALVEVDRERALVLAADAEQAARTVTDPEVQAEALANLAADLAGVDRERALVLATDAEQADIVGPFLPPHVSGVLARVGAYDRAEALARSITHPAEQAWALVKVAAVLAGVGAYDRAEALARSITDPKDQAWAMAQLVKTLLASSERDRAERLDRRITNPQESPRRRASHLLAFILTGEGWLEAVQSLGKLNASAVVAIHEAMATLNQASTWPDSTHAAGNERWASP